MNKLISTLVAMIIAFPLSASANDVSTPLYTITKQQNLMFISGQRKGDMSKSEDAGVAIKEALQRIKEIVENDAHRNITNIVQMNVYLADVDSDYPVLAKIMLDFFGEEGMKKVARTVVGVSAIPDFVMVDGKRVDVKRRVSIDAVVAL